MYTQDINGGVPSLFPSVLWCVTCRYYEDDQEVLSDNELQELVNELSADGKQGDFGGDGMVQTLFTPGCNYLKMAEQGGG